MQLWKQNTNVLHIMLQLLPSSSRSTLPALVPSVPGSSFPCCLKRRADEGGSGQQSRGRHMSFSQTDPSLVLTNLAVWEAACSHAHYITPISRTAHTHKCISRNVTSTHMHFFFFCNFVLVLGTGLHLCRVLLEQDLGPPRLGSAPIWLDPAPPLSQSEFVNKVLMQYLANRLFAYFVKSRSVSFVHVSWGDVTV